MSLWHGCAPWKASEGRHRLMVHDRWIVGGLQSAARPTEENTTLPWPCMALLCRRLPLCCRIILVSPSPTVHHMSLAPSSLPSLSVNLPTCVPVPRYSLPLHTSSLPLSPCQLSVYVCHVPLCPGASVVVSVFPHVRGTPIPELLHLKAFIVRHVSSSARLRSDPTLLCLLGDGPARSRRVVHVRRRMTSMCFPRLYYKGDFIGHCMFLRIYLHLIGRRCLKS